MGKFMYSVKWTLAVIGSMAGINFSGTRVFNWYEEHQKQNAIVAKKAVEEKEQKTITTTLEVVKIVNDCRICDEAHITFYYVEHDKCQTGDSINFSIKKIRNMPIGINSESTGIELTGKFYEGTLIEIISISVPTLEQAVIVKQWLHGFQ